MMKGRGLTDLHPVKSTECAFPSCGRKVWSKGWCGAHYIQQWEGKEMFPIRGGKSEVRRDEISHYIELKSRRGVVVGHTRVSAEDVAKVEGITWRLMTNGYASARVGGLYLHRFLFDLTDSDDEVDHISGDKLDNRRGNLRRVTCKENTQNLAMRRNNTTGYRNVSPVKGGYAVYVNVDKKQYHGGVFESVHDAGRAAVALRADLMTHHVEARYASPPPIAPARETTDDSQEP